MLYSIDTEKKEPYIIALIPARSGSKGIVHKNIKLYNGKPLMYWSIKNGLDSKYIDNVIVSTDSKLYMDIAKECGATVPFLRPKEISQDDSTDFQFVEHYLKELKSDGKTIPDIIVHLRPTYPNRKTELLDKAIEEFLDKRKDYDSLRSVVLSEKSPYKMYNIDNGELVPLFNTVSIDERTIIEPYNSSRQILPKTYLHNGCIDIFNSNIIENNTITGKIYPFIMEKTETYDIDNEKDWNKSLSIKN